MGWVLLIIVLIAAALGILGAVLKLAAAIILALVLVVLILGAVAYFGFKSWVKDMERRGQTTVGPDGSTTTTYQSHSDSYDVQGWVRRQDGPALPPADDDPDQD